jgi:dihydrofolate reductase
MAKLHYGVIISLDGYVADESGNFDWAEPDEEVHSFVNDLVRPFGIYLYGRRMYEVMLAWETLNLAEHPPPMQDFARIWRAADKVVFSKSLEHASSTRTRIEHDFDVNGVRQMKIDSKADLSVSGPHLAAQAIEAGLVDEYHLFLAPHVAGGGNRALPDGVRLPLELRKERRFQNGTVYLRYRPSR